MLISRYTHLFKSSEEVPLLYSSRSNSFLELPEDLYSILWQAKSDNNLLNEIDDETLDFLRERKIIVGEYDDEDYLLECQYYTDVNSYSKASLGLTIVPTLDCNCNCFYCFEKGKKAEVMTDETIDAIINFINDQTESNYLSLSWFGGEPLLELGIIEKLLDRIVEETHKDINGHSIITNGILFNKRAIDLFKDFPLTNIQITLDGSRDRHDNIRRLKKDGKPTFDQILSNIDNIVTYLPDTAVSIRVNVEKKNIDDFYEINDIVSKRWTDKNVSAYPGFLYLDNKEKTDFSCSVFNNIEKSRLMLEMGIKLNREMYPELSPFKGCMATTHNSFIILPNGDMCKCMNDVTFPEKVIGNIVTKKMKNTTLLYRYMSAGKWYHNNKCRECFFMPVCKGACTKDLLRNMYEGTKLNLCDCYYKHTGMLDKYLETFYKHQKKNTAEN